MIDGLRFKGPLISKRGDTIEGSKVLRYPGGVCSRRFKGILTSAMGLELKVPKAFRQPSQFNIEG